MSRNAAGRKYIYNSNCFTQLEINFPEPAMTQTDVDNVMTSTWQDEENLSFFLNDWYWGKYDSQCEDREIMETWNTNDYPSITCKG